MAATREVAFELERFDWVGEDRLEVVGRWQGLSGRRLTRPALSVEAGGHRHRLSAVPGGHLASPEGALWKAAFAWPYGPEPVEAAELEVARSIVVELPVPRTKRRVPGATSPSADLEERRLREEVAALRDELAELRAARDAEAAAPPPPAPEPPPAPGAEVEGERERIAAELALLTEAHASLASEHQTLGDQQAALIAQNGELRGEVAEALDAQERQAAELRAARDELSQLRADLNARDEALARVARDLEAAREEADRRVEAERSATTEVRQSLAGAREEAQRGLAAEVEETERLRMELGSAREEAERALAAERAETARLREELSDATASGGEDTTDGSGRRMYEAVAQELEHERATVRDLRRELDNQQAQTAARRRTLVSSATNGVTSTDEAPRASTPAGRAGRRSAASVMAARSDAAERTPVRRADAARAAAAHRVPEHEQSAVGVWATRVAALVLVAVLLGALIIIVSSVA